MRQRPSNYKINRINPPRPVEAPPRLRHAPVTGRGPRILHHPVVHTGGPGTPPPGFVTPTTSLDEWYWYWASMRVLDPLTDPAQPPFYGGLYWGYQKAALGGHVRALGSAVVDFVYMLAWPYIAVRIQTYRFHLATDAAKQAYDVIQDVALSRRFEVMDIFSQDYIADETGETAVLMVKEMLGLVRHENPLTAHTTLLIRPGSTFG